MTALQLATFEKNWDYKLLDTGDGYRLEQWGEVILARPDPQIIWNKSLPDSEWVKAWATYKPASDDGKGQWQIKKPLPNPWIIECPILNNLSSKGEGGNTIKFLLKLSPFKHTGLFAEQASNWEWMLERIMNNELRIKNGEKPSPLPLSPQEEGKARVLNLFAYTGGATVVLAKAGCQVTHVDASKPAISWANENHKLNKLPIDSVRWILDDCVKFVKREVKRGVKYDGIIMDPPAFGHSPDGKTWKFNSDLPGLLTDCVKLLSEKAKFLIINGYATNSSAIALHNLLEDAMQNKKSANWRIESGELCLKQTNGRQISTGIFTRCSPTKN